MKVVITGEKGYIARNVCAYLTEMGYECKCVSVREGIFNEPCDVVIHCAAIVHKREKKYAAAYKKINTDLAADIAEASKKMGVKHFIFLSSMSVYGGDGEINSHTPVIPDSLYGKSKFFGERKIKALESEDFKVSVIRPPMVYGKGCPGNYRKLSLFIRLSPVFPLINNKKSFIYIENLAYHIERVIKEDVSQTTRPMDPKHISTSTFAKLIAQAQGKKIFYESRFLGNILTFFGKVKFIRKIFASRFYSEEIAVKIHYVSVEDAVIRTEEKQKNEGEA